MYCLFRKRLMRIICLLFRVSPNWWRHRWACAIETAESTHKTGPVATQQLARRCGRPAVLSAGQSSPWVGLRGRRIRIVGRDRSLSPNMVRFLVLTGCACAIDLQLGALLIQIDYIVTGWGGRGVSIYGQRIAAVVCVLHKNGGRISTLAVYNHQTNVLQLGCGG